MNNNGYDMSNDEFITSGSNNDDDNNNYKSISN